jgi:hypothetical protein
VSAVKQANPAGRAGAMREARRTSLRMVRAGRFMLLTLPVLMLDRPAHASLFEGEALDTMANILSWVVLFIAPAVGIVVFWMLHILPEKIAEKRHHPQAKAIQTLCLLSLFFGGLLWPIAWLWAYSKPVLYKIAYGTDKVVHGEEHGDHAAEGTSATPATPAAPPSAGREVRAAELNRLRQRVIELETGSARRTVAKEETA